MNKSPVYIKNLLTKYSMFNKSCKLLLSKITENGVEKCDNCKVQVNKSDNKNLKETRPIYTPGDDFVEEPTTCCMSGCANCVWIQYAEKLSETMNGSSEEVQKIIMEKVTDPNMRAFLSMELRVRNIIK